MVPFVPRRIYHEPTRSVVIARAVGAFAVVATLAGCSRPGAVAEAQELVRLHRDDEAVQKVQAHLAAHADDRLARRLLIRLYGSRGDLAAAKREVAELARQMPGDSAPWIEMGHAFELAHRFDDALDAYDEAARVAPASPDGPLEGGLRSARWGEVEQALPRLEEAVRRGARSAHVFHALGLVRLHAGDLDGAERAYEGGREVDPKSTENLLGLASVAVARGDARAALAAYDGILVERPAFAAAELGRAWALARLGRMEQGREALRHAEQLGASTEKLAPLRALLH